MSESHTKPMPVVALPTFPHGVPLAWAVACGAVSVVGLRWTLPLAGRALAAALLVEFAFRWIVWLLVQRDAREAPPKARAPLFALPYAQLDSPAQRFAAWLTGALRVVWLSPRGLRARTLLSLSLAGAFLALWLGAPAAWIGAAILALALATGLWLRASSAPAAVWSPALLAALAWACGAAASGRVDARLAAAPLFGLATAGLAAVDGGMDWGKGLFLAGLTAPAALLVAFRLALPAALLAFAAVPACAILVPARGASPALARAVRPLLWLSMALAALALGL